MPSRSRITYHSQIKILAHARLLPDNVMRSIPKSNISRWRKECKGKYETFKLDLVDADELHLLQTFSRHKTFKSVFAAYVRISKTMLGWVHSLREFKQIISENRKQVVQLVERVRATVGIRRLLNIFHISSQTYRNWRAQTFTDCFESVFGKCRRTFPNQLTKGEVTTMKLLLTDERFQYWPVSSIAFHALKSNILPLNLSTWYKYVYKLGIERLKPRSRRKKHALGIRALKPNEIWHADITQFETDDHQKHFLYLVADNFSRKILSFKIADSVKASFRKETILSALQPIDQKPVTLITDGGPENQLQDLPESIVHKIAQLDIHYSNSMIEAHNKIIKYNYLYRAKIPDIAALEKLLPSFIENFNNRPHISLDGLTPNEAYAGMQLNDAQLNGYKRAAREKRRLHTQIHRCNHC